MNPRPSPLRARLVRLLLQFQARLQPRPNLRLRPILLVWLLLCGLGAAVPAQARPRHPAKAPASSAQPKPYAQRPEVMQQCADMAQALQLERRAFCRTLGQARMLPQVVQLMRPAPAGVPKNWAAYRSRFVEPVRIQAGLQFWQAQRQWLDQAEAQYGVPASIVVGIIGVETLYGRNTGRFRVLDALATLAFDFPAEHPRAAERSAFFKAELGQFLKLAQAHVLDPLGARGSYAGAMGMPQFMPSSWVRFAVDFDGDGRIDLQHSAADVIGSVAHYFSAFGWQPGLITHVELPALGAAEATPETVSNALPNALPDTAADAAPVAARPPELQRLLAADILPTISPAQWRAAGLPLPPAAAPLQGPLALVELQNGAAAPSYVLGTENFYVITRYNWSSYYAMAVIELGQAVQQALAPAP